MQWSVLFKQICQYAGEADVQWAEKKNYSRQLFGLVTTKNDYEKPFKQRGVEQIRKLWLTTLDEIKVLLGTG